MPFPSVRHLHVAGLPWREINPGKPNHVRLKELNRDPATGAHLWLVNEPAGFKGSGGGRPHYLPVDEEALFLSGRMVGDPETTYQAGDYLFFPKGFLHSPDDATDIGAEILMRFSGPMSYVNGELPRGRAWSRSDERQMLPRQANSRTPVSRRRTADLAWEDLRLDGEPTGERVRLLSQDRGTGACSFMLQVPSGWRSPTGRRTSAVTREWFVLDAGMTTGGADGAHLTRWDYRCLAPGEPFGGPGEASAGGCTLFCWSDGPLDHIGEDGHSRAVTLG
jgi:hypothetical protein